MSSRRPSHLRPVVVEVQPDFVTASAAHKAVRFAPTSANTSSRPLSTVEAWSLYNFEVHARACPTCYHPKVSRLCDTGYALSQDIACHIFSRDSEIYAVKKDASGLVRVEIPHGYTRLRSLLKSTERALRKHSLTTPSPSPDYARVYPISSTRRTYRPDATDNVVIEPASTESTHRRKHRHRYTTVAADKDLEEVTIKPLPTTPSSSKERRGTLYERESQRRREGVRIEVREPDVQDPERRYRRHSIWL